MAESYTYDPKVGSAVPTSQLQESIEEPTPVEELNRYRVDKTADGLANRGNHTSSVGDQGNVDLEIQLQQTQQKLSRREFSNVLEEQQLIQQAESLAAQLIGADGVPQFFNLDEPEQPKEDFEEEYLNNNPEVEADLKYASEVMSEGLVNQMNTLISEGDELTKVATLDTLKNLRQNPDSFMSASESTGIDAYTEQQIASQYGPDMAHAISVLGNGVARGVITTSQAIETAGKDPDLQRALFSLASQGVIRIAL